MSLLDFSYVLLIIWRGNHQHKELASSVRGGVGCEGNSIGLFGEQLHVPMDLVMPQMPAANLETQKITRGRDRGFSLLSRQDRSRVGCLCSHGQTNPQTTDHEQTDLANC